MTPRQRQAYDFICGFIATRGYSPSFREIGEAIGEKHNGGIHRIVHELVSLGHCTFDHHRARSIKPTRLCCPKCGEAFNAVEARPAA